jgi:hypothetical protein
MTDPFRARCKDCPHLQEVERERDSLKRFALRSLRVGEWLAGTGFVGDPQCPEDPDNLFLDLVEFLGLETDEEYVAALAKLGTPVISQPDNKPDNASAPLQASNVSAPQHTCGDCSLVRENGFCGVRPNAFFYRGSTGQICLDFSLRAANPSEKEAI